MSRVEVTKSLKQLATVLRLEQDKEQSALQAFKTAQDYYQQQRAKLTSLQQYRLEYMRQIQQEGGNGVGALHYQQRLSFVGKLDKACEQQGHIIAQSKMAVDQRRGQWLAQQRRRQAVEKLIEKKQQSLQIIDNRLEQQMMDELAIQRLRRNAM
ncbi:flagellar export protein FliJ [Alteromonas gilva]|uniref:Flagellar FliJ protein n=1 Tax=Alteromonas gilva TaxID=2987522 RepID=A0ABT5L0D0_9ALTE|nr:flagellar export protein FliJ [Alteromonas gilva]MDC8830494.1 flagellar export protein FliJ [Alteromonas gilva]